MKKFKTLGYVLSLALGMTMLTGCGKKVDGVDQQSMIDKYAAYCDLQTIRDWNMKRQNRP